jgi:uncharacterized OsmC-like protein
VNDFLWTVRVRADTSRTLTVHARNHAFPAGEALSFRPANDHPSALELMLGAFAADLTATFRSLAAKNRLTLDALEFSATCQLNNPLIHVGVIGETGHPGVERIEATLYVSSDEDESELAALWAATLERSPLYNTLCRSVQLVLRMQPTT